AAAQAAHHELVELAVEQDDTALEAYLGGEEPDVETLKRCIRKGAIAAAFVPVLCGSAFKNKGVQPLLDAVVDYLPAPTDVPAIAGLRSTTAGDTLADSSQPVVLEKMEFPDPVIEIAVEPKTKGDQEKMGQALARLATEDPSFRVAVDHESGQTIIKGMGE